MQEEISIRLKTPTELNDLVTVCFKNLINSSPVIHEVNIRRMSSICILDCAMRRILAGFYLAIATDEEFE